MFSAEPASQVTKQTTKTRDHAHIEQSSQLTRRGHVMIRQVKQVTSTVSNVN